MAKDRLTPQERALIEVVCRVFPEGTDNPQAYVPRVLRELSIVVRDYRESQQKWRVNPDYKDQLDGPCDRLVFVYEDAYRDRVLALLNAGEKALETKDQ